MRLVSFRSVRDARAPGGGGPAPGTWRASLLRRHTRRDNLRRRERRQSRLCPSGSGTQTDARRPASCVRERRVGPGSYTATLWYRDGGRRLWRSILASGLWTRSLGQVRAWALSDPPRSAPQLRHRKNFAAGFTERDGVVSAQLEEQGPESDE